jgi:hypothetical protein
VSLLLKRGLERREPRKVSLLSTFTFDYAQVHCSSLSKVV